MTTAKAGYFLWHLLQMVLAMAAGMAIYVALARLILTSEGYHTMQIDHPFLWYSEMAVFMTVPMIALMRRHGHRWRPVTEMSAAMLIPPIALIALVQRGLMPWLSARTLPESTHIVMLFGMLVSMVYRRADYTDGARHEWQHHKETTR
jgi:hypothetical protein